MSADISFMPFVFFLVGLLMAFPFVLPFVIVRHSKGFAVDAAGDIRSSLN